MFNVMSMFIDSVFSIYGLIFSDHAINIRHKSKLMDSNYFNFRFLSFSWLDTNTRRKEIERLYRFKTEFNPRLNSSFAINTSFYALFVWRLALFCVTFQFAFVFFSVVVFHIDFFPLVRVKLS